MDKFLRTTLIVLGILVLVAVLFGLGMQLYWAVASPRVAAFSPMMGRAWGMHGGMVFGGFPFLGSLLGLGLVILVVVGMIGLVRGIGSRTPVRACAHCGAPLQAGWIACPRCGEKV
ncbi:MAG TPA: zinc ribbon domain-containing protein [Anaerolineales bacterium]|nr:zinc ribbon domain-containing protein [Anaerolineales bacterium]